MGNRGTMCNTSSQGENHTAGDTDRFALVTRGGCKFATKAENAVREGFSGVVILDNQNTTNVNKISGSRSALTDGIPVIFLLQTEANLLIKLMEEEDRRNISITGEKTLYIFNCTCNWTWQRRNLYDHNLRFFHIIRNFLDNHYYNDHDDHSSK